MNNFAIEIKNLTKEYKDFTLDKVSFSIEKGSIMGLIGQNGAGKTTLIKLILNAINRTSGEVSVLGFDNIDDEVQVKKLIGYVADEDYLVPTNTLKEHEKVFRLMYDNWDKELFESLINKWNLPYKKKIVEYSKGMKTKAMLALTLAHHPKILILDEPTAGLDPVARIEVLDLLREFVEDGEKSVLFSTHITGDLDKIADYVTMIIGGKITESAGSDEIEEKYAVISGGIELIKGKENLFVGIRKGTATFEGLVFRDNLQYFADVNVQNPTIENILTFTIWAT